MAVKLIGRRYLGLSAILLTVLLCLYYANYTILNPGKPPSAQTAEQPLNNRLLPVDAAAPGHEQQQPPPPPPPPISSKKTNHECGLKPASADIDTVGIYSNFEFQVFIYASHTSPRAIRKHIGLSLSRQTIPLFSYS